MNQKKVNTRMSYSQEFKTQPIELAKEMGSKKAAEKLGIKSLQTLAAWVRYSTKLADERQNVAILKDCTRFFCMENGK